MAFAGLRDSRRWIRRTIHAIGVALAHSLKHESGAAKVLLGMDTRESSGWIAGTLTAGLMAGGATVESAGVITTPAIAFLAREHKFSAGVVISASHNPWEDNGIKLFGPDGYKLPDATELRIEEEIFRALERTSGRRPWSKSGRLEVNEADRAEYVRFLLAAVPGLALDNRRIVIDCANGAASSVAPQLFSDLAGEVVITHASPTGRNINEYCGALHPDVVAAEVVQQKASMGVTFDGDADRCLFADEHGTRGEWGCGAAAGGAGSAGARVAGGRDGGGDDDVEHGAGGGAEAVGHRHAAGAGG